MSAKYFSTGELNFCNIQKMHGIYVKYILSKDEVTELTTNPFILLREPKEQRVVTIISNI